MTSFRYPPQPLDECDRFYELVEAISNDRFILTQRNDLEIGNVLDGDFLVYDRYRNHWFGPIQMPVEKNRQISVWLLRFVDTHCFLFQMAAEAPTIFTSETVFYMVLARLSTSLREATIISRCRLQNPLYTRYYPLLRVNHLLGITYSDMLCIVYDISETLPVVLDTFSVGHRALYVTQLGQDIFIVCKPSDSRSPVIMKSYNLDDHAISEVPNFNPRLTANDDRRNYYDMNFGSAKNLLVTHLKQFTIAFYVFDLALRQPLFAVSTHIYTFFTLLGSGEALQFNDSDADYNGADKDDYDTDADDSDDRDDSVDDDSDECRLECKWFLPPKLAEIAIRVVHASMPSVTKELLKASSVDCPQALVRFLLES